jgi:ribosomal protein L13E
MVKHNNVIPNNHFRKHWQRNVRVWLNQSQRKHRRLIARRAKAASLSPRPIEALRPAVRCQTIRYNHRPRLGRGFTLAEIKAAGLGVQFARSVGISVDHRRKNRNQESLELNKNRLLAYVNKLVLFPRSDKAPVTKAKHGILNDTPKVFFTINCRKTKRSAVLFRSMPFPPSSRESDQFLNCNWKDLEKPVPTDQLDKSGTTKEMKEKDLKRKEKLLRKTDLLKYLNFPYSFFAFNWNTLSD